jgi:HTH-type transcriptional regulator/antitoxin HigA
VVIRSEAEYARLLGQAEKLMAIPEERLTAEQGRVLELLALLIERYEDEHHPLPRCAPHEMLAVLLEERGEAPRDLWDVVGSKSRVSELLAGKRVPSKAQAKKLAGHFGVGVELFL